MKYFLFFLVIFGGFVIITTPAYAMCAFDLDNPFAPCDDTIGTLEYPKTPDEIIPAPLKQMNLGIKLGHIICDSDKSPVWNVHYKPACVYPDSEGELLTRGWAKLRLLLPAGPDPIKELEVMGQNIFSLRILGNYIVGDEKYPLSEPRKKELSWEYSQQYHSGESYLEYTITPHQNFYNTEDKVQFDLLEWGNYSDCWDLQVRILDVQNNPVYEDNSVRHCYEPDELPGRFHSFSMGDDFEEFVCDRPGYYRIEVSNGEIFPADILENFVCIQHKPEPEPIPEPEIIQETTFDSDKYYEEFGSGSPLIYKSSSKPILDYDNCKRYAYWLTEHQKEKIDKYEDYPRYPPWGNQIFPLVDFCIANGDFLKTAVGDKIQWSFYEIYSENKPNPDSFRSSEPTTKIEVSFGQPYNNGLAPVTISEVTIFAEELDEITVWNFELIGHSGDDRYISWDTLHKEDRIGYQILNDDSEDAIDHSRMPNNLAIPGDQHIYELDCSIFNRIEGESAHPTTFPIEKGNYAIIAKNSRMGIFPDSNGDYSFEFASIFPHYVRFPDVSETIFSSDTKQCSSTWQIDSESGEEHGDGYYTSMTFRFE